MMRLISALLSIIFSTLVFSLGQENTQPSAWLIRSRFGGGDVPHYTQEVALIFGDHRDDPGVRAAIRICSRDPLPLALNTAAASPFLMERYLTEFYGYSRARILFLRAEDCLGSQPAPAITESWLVPRGAELPASVELVSSCQISLEFVPQDTQRDEAINNAREYRTALQEFAEKLKSRPGAVGIVLAGYYVEAGDRLTWPQYRRPRSLMGQRVREARNVLTRLGLPQDRYFTRVHPWVTNCGRGCDFSEQPRYPQLRIIEIKRSCE